MNVVQKDYESSLEAFGNIFGQLALMEVERSHVDIAEARGIIVQKLFDIMIEQENERRANGGAPILPTEPEEEDIDDDCVILTPIELVDGDNGKHKH